jgi:hypothetical protein
VRFSLGRKAPELRVERKVSETFDTEHADEQIQKWKHRSALGPQRNPYKPADTGLDHIVPEALELLGSTGDDLTDLIASNTRKGEIAVLDSLIKQYESSTDPGPLTLGAWLHDHGIRP